MRLHSLHLEAFGPFPGVETIDFDVLGEHGVHLIHGPTGAGKTTILDAICFALFGQVPGARRGQRASLRSDHAERSASPRVVLDLTVAGRRLRLERSPEHIVPKKHGTGETRRQAKVVLSERVGGQWRGVSNRLDEVGEVITQALGMGLDQFAQVVLLPQGQFAAFLQAKPDERGALLRRLFDIERFADVEDWLAARRRELATATADARARVTGELRVLESVLGDLPPSTEQVPWSELPDDQLPAALAAERERACATADAAMAQAARAESDAERAREVLIRARTTTDLQQQAQVAQGALDRLLDQQPTITAAQAELAAARRAAQVEPARLAAERADRELVRLTARRAQTRAALLGVIGSSWAQALDDRLAAALRTGAETLLETRRLADEAAAAQTAQRRADQALQHSQTLLPQLQATAQDAAHRLAALEATRAELSVTVDTLLEAPARLERVQAAVRSQTELAGARSSRDAAQAQTAAALRTFHAAETRVIQLRALRLEHLAATLAEGLRPGDACPVCGASEHPQLASMPLVDLSEDALDAAEARAAHDAGALREATAAEAVAQASVETIRATLASACGELGVPMPDQTLNGSAAPAPGPSSAAPRPTTGPAADPPDSLAGLLQSSRADAARLQEARRVLTRTAAQIDATTTERDTARSRREDAERDLAARAATARAAAQRSAQVTEQLTTALHAHGSTCPCASAGESRPLPPEHTEVGRPTDDDHHVHLDDHRAALADLTDLHELLAQQRGRHDRVSTAVAEHQAADQAAHRAAQTAQDATTEAGALATQQGFADLAQVRAAWRDDVTITELECRIADQHAATLRAAALLEQDAVRLARYVPQPDVDALQRRSHAAATRAREAQATMATAQRAATRLGEVDRSLTEALDAWRPLETERRRVTDLADVVSGGGDNIKRMRLSSYVLAARLEEVTRLANERLSVMTEGRYALAHSDARAKGGLRSGLGLMVQDAWTGQTRDTATLSGGESFLASLALALGLGEAVRQDAGGIELQSLFVDEGFGSLDEDTLEQVLGVLDSLRAGGRSVGIVSHVTELQHRVPARVEVLKTEHGSRLRVIGPTRAVA